MPSLLHHMLKFQTIGYIGQEILVVSCVLRLIDTFDSKMPKGRRIPQVSQKTVLLKQTALV
jgi:hypothetical protein